MTVTSRLQIQLEPLTQGRAQAYCDIIKESAILAAGEERTRIKWSTAAPFIIGTVSADYMLSEMPEDPYARFMWITARELMSLVQAIDRHGIEALPPAKRAERVGEVIIALAYADPLPQDLPAERPAPKRRMH